MAANEPDQLCLKTPLTATCLCKAVQLRLPPPIEGPVSNYLCHCLDCRHELGSLFAWQVRYHTNDVHIAKGEEFLSRWSAETDLPDPTTGERGYLGFCRVCGTSLISAGHGTIAVRGGALDLDGGSRDLVREWIESEEGRARGWWPKMEVFTKRRPAWFKQFVEGAQQRRELEQ